MFLMEGRIALKKLGLLVCMVLIGILSPAIGSGRVVDRIVAIVNDDIITLSELETTFEPFRKRISATYPGPDKDKVLAEGRTAILNRVIDNRLIRQRAKQTGIEVGEEDILATLNNMLRNRNMSMAVFAKNLEQEGLSLDSYRQDMKDQMTRMRLLRRELKAKLLVTDDEIGDHYAKHRQEYEGKEAVRIKQILILLPRDADRETAQKIRDKAEEIRKRLIAGEPFDALSAQYSQGPSAATGGDVGFMEKGSMLPEVDSIAFRLTKDETSEVIESPAGFHIIRILDKRGAGIKPIEVVREEIKTKIEEEKMEKGFGEWITELRKRSHIEIKL
jgi:parvulin-like peptidyl-prolyl isomerase